MASPIFMSGNSHRSPLRCSSRSSLRRNEALQVELGAGTHPTHPYRHTHTHTQECKLASVRDMLCFSANCWAQVRGTYVQTHHAFPPVLGNELHTQRTSGLEGTPAGLLPSPCATSVYLLYNIDGYEMRNEARATQDTTPP